MVVIAMISRHFDTSQDCHIAQGRAFEQAMILSGAVGELDAGWKCRPGVLMCVEQATVFQGSRSDLNCRVRSMDVF